MMPPQSFPQSSQIPFLLHYPSKFIFWVAVVIIFKPQLTQAQVTSTQPPPLKPLPLQISTTGELGMLIPLSHRIQFGKEGTEIDYIGEGGQDNAFVFARLEAEVDLKQRHKIVLLYQPLNLETQIYSERDLVIDEAVFPAESGVDLRYGFDFYRASYLYDLRGDDPRSELALGGSIQLRNATINFTSSDGLFRRTNRDLGVVPLLKLRWRRFLGDRLWVGTEIDGMYAPIKYINGSNSDVEGAIIDFSLRCGVTLDQGRELFANLRWIGGGAQGTSSQKDGPGDGFTSNWLNFLSFSLGMRWQHL